MRFGLSTSLWAIGCYEFSTPVRECTDSAVDGSRRILWFGWEIGVDLGTGRRSRPS